MEFEPVATSRANAGWTAEKQGYFLRHLAATGSVAQSCALVGMSVRSIYYLRARPDAYQFRRAWGQALQIAGGAVLATAYERALNGVPRQLYRDGKLVGEVVVPSDRMLTWLLNRLNPSLHPPADSPHHKPFESQHMLADIIGRLQDCPPTALDLEELEAAEATEQALLAPIPLAPSTP